MQNATEQAKSKYFDKDIKAKCVDPKSFPINSNFAFR